MKIPQQEFLSVSSDELKEKYPNLSSEDINFYFPKKKILDFKIEIISLRNYNNLLDKQKEFDNYNYLNPNSTPKNLSELELNQIESFKNKNVLVDKKKCFDNELAHWDKIHSKSENKTQYIDGIIPIKENIYKNFLISYKYLNNVDFILTEESIKNIEPIIKYFSFDKTFFDSENCLKKIGGKELEPSFEKGILIIGNVGNGKSSVMKALQFMFDFYFKKSIEKRWNTAGDWQKLCFKFKTTESLVSEYEFITSPQEKEMYFSKYSKGNLLLDDIKKEKDASNFGITNVVKSIFEKRYNNQKNYSDLKTKKTRTFATMNFHEKYPNDINLAIQECGIKYGSHIHDRIFEMFNIVEFKGKSLRK